jgi:hypothetical protein
LVAFSPPKFRDKAAPESADAPDRTAGRKTPENLGKPTKEMAE